MSLLIECTCVYAGTRIIHNQDWKNQQQHQLGQQQGPPQGLGVASTGELMVLYTNQ
jgi:hypothetical protein